MTGANSNWASRPNLQILRTASNNPAGYYFEFTLTANPGVKMNLSGFSFDGGPAAATTTRGYELHVLTGSVDDLVLSGTFPTTPNRNGGPVGVVMPSYSVGLTDAVFQGISSATFRMYFITPGVSESVDFDNLAVIGSVPEPASFGFVAGGGLLMLRRRSRKHA